MDYHLKPLGRTCATTGQPLSPGMICHSVLIERNGRFERLDFSPGGWSGLPDGAIGQWHCVVPEAQDADRQRLDPDSLMRLFEQLCEDASPAQAKLRYVLALLLLRKRRVKLDGARKADEVEFLELLGTRGEGPFEVRDYQLGDAEIAGLQADLDRYFETEWAG